ncbi:hormone-sensitive lipase [Nephila pilipes]|uniref:Hormone-sensitive lipase n=1 Tax=Nephila pilipes TaxID=299642 RepID=A0A8X6UX60_NEPPI|nr:hormone-sensitive lipase [Nephila pilipes]
MNNIDYFFYLRDKYWYAEKFVSLLRDLLSLLEWYEEHIKELYDNAPRFDFNNVQGNGFRSFCLIFERCFTDCYKFCKKLINARNSIFFRPETYLRETENLVSIVSALKPGLKFVFKLLAENPDYQLLTPNKAITAEEVVIECGSINQFGFYGRHQGFYYCNSMKRILQGVSVIMATFSDLYRTSGGPICKAALTILNGLKYIMNPELRAYHIVDVAQNSSVEFLKAFWSLSETQFMKRLPSWVCPKLHVREEIFIPDKSITLNNMYSNESVVIPAPTSHIPSAPVRCLLLSVIQRDGQILKKNKKSNLAPKSKSLLFHCHGGGFVSQNPESHEIYLRHWAHDLNVPIISVDYSLSPEAPFPRALEEVLLTYAWVLQNPDKLGWTGETICFVGDSAGGNVLMGVVLKTIALQIRQPDAIMCCYTPLILDIVPSPSRLLCWIDPLLPLGFMISCIDAYAGAMTTEEDEYDVESEHVLSGRRSRKISSISEIFDSSLNFLKQNEWMEVEANEPSEKIVENICYDTDDYTDYVDSNNYMHGSIKEYDKKACEINKSKDFSYDEEYIIFNLPLDLFFDVKTKCQKVADTGLNKISDIFMSTSFYQKVISPFLPDIGLRSQNKIQSSTYDKKSILQKIRMLKIVSKNPFMSPLLASDKELKEMPPVYFVSLNFDPCLDDSITFAKRLQSLNRQVVIDVLDGLPHGFLNFLPFSQEAHDGSNLCVRRLKEVLKLS